MRELDRSLEKLQKDSAVSQVWSEDDMKNNDNFSKKVKLY